MILPLGERFGEELVGMDKDGLIAVGLAILVSGGLLVLMARQLPQDSIRLEPLEGPSTPTPPVGDSVTIDPPAQQLPDAPAVTLESLRAACVTEARQVDLQPQQRTACARYEQAANHEAANRPRPRVTQPAHEPAPSAVAPHRRASEPERAQMTGGVCGVHPYGSIAYRECRASEKKRLLALCKRATDNAEATLGAYREQMKETARAHCRTAELYRIVN